MTKVSSSASTDPVSLDALGTRQIGFDRARHTNCSEVFWQNLERNPNATALTGPSGAVTYVELIESASRWGNALRDFGLKTGERVILFLDDTPFYPAVFFGAVRAGFVPVLLNTQSPRDTLAYYLQDSQARVAVCDLALSEMFDTDLLRGSAIEEVVVVGGESALPQRHTVEAFSSGTTAVLGCADTGPEDMAFWMYSSGTTGRPKGSAPSSRYGVHTGFLWRTGAWYPF